MLGHPSWLSSQSHAGNGDAKFKADEVPLLVLHHTASFGVGKYLVFLEASLDVVIRSFDTDPDALADVITHGCAVGVQRGHHVDHTLSRQYTALGFEPHNRGNFLDGRRCKGDAFSLHMESSGICDCRAFDSRLR